MGFNDIATEAAIHRAAVVALLRSYLPHGRRGPAARAVGISPTYLSRVLSDQHYGDLNRLEPLGQDLAERLVSWLGLDTRLRDQLLEHAYLSHESRAKAYTKIEAALSHRELDVMLPELQKLHRAASSASNPSLASNLFTMSYYMVKQFIERIPPREYPLEFAQVCLILNDLEAVLDYNVDGIYHARLTRHWARVGGAKRSNLLGKDADILWGNAVVADAVSAHNLGLDKEAIFLSRVAFTKAIKIWSCEAALHLLKCTAFAQRTSLRLVDKLLEQYLEAVEKFGSGTDHTTSRLAFLEAKLRAYLACDLTKTSLKKANVELEQCISETTFNGSEERRVFALVNQTSTLRSVIFLNTYSQLLKARGDFVRAEKVRVEAELRANRAGLTHQFASIRVDKPFH